MPNIISFNVSDTSRHVARAKDLLKRPNTAAGLQNKLKSALDKLSSDKKAIERIKSQTSSQRDILTVIKTVKKEVSERIRHLKLLSMRDKI